MTWPFLGEGEEDEDAQNFEVNRTNIEWVTLPAAPSVSSGDLLPDVRLTSADVRADVTTKISRECPEFYNQRVVVSKDMRWYSIKSSNFSTSSIITLHVLATKFCTKASVPIPTGQKKKRGTSLWGGWGREFEVKKKNKIVARPKIAVQTLALLDAQERTSI